VASLSGAGRSGRRGAAKQSLGPGSLRALGSLGRRAAETLVRVHGHVIFSRSRLVGALLLGATATCPAALAHGVLAVAVASATARLLGLEREGEHGVLREGPYGYNALLVGLGVAHTFGGASLASGSLASGSLASGPAWAATAALAAAAAVVCTLLTAGLSSLFSRVASLPVLSVPFVLVSWLLVGVAPMLGISPVQQAAPLFGSIAPEPLAGALRGLGSLFYLHDEAAGALVLAALLVHSRIGALLAAGAIALAMAVAGAAGLAGPSLETTLVVNGALTAIAAGGVWFVPSASSFALAASGVALSSALVLGLSGPLDRVGLPLLILPFNLSLGLLLCATRQRLRDASPKSVDFDPGSPEENLAYFQARLARFDALYATAFTLPFRGAWTCTQGEDGAHTHQGAWRHGFDFEVEDQEGELFAGDGASLEDHHCFRLPVLAAADGVVVKVERDVPDNAVGGVDLKRNWGNVVLVYHAPGLYSLVAHLARNSARVHEGQQVRRGDVLGLCGSSGRSPRPHLHFQLQGGPQLGAPTLPCRFSDAVRVASPWAARLSCDSSLEWAQVLAGHGGGGKDGRGTRATHDEPGRLATTLLPLEGQRLRNLEPDAELAACFALEPGSVLALRMGGQVEHLEHEIDLLGGLVLRSREHGARLYFSRTGEGFTALDALGSRRSAVHVLRAALARVPFDASPGLTWRDYLPARWSGWRAARVLLDFIAPFAPSAGLEITYSARRERGLLVIEGESRRLRRALPIVRTSATLSPAHGLLRLELEAPGHHLIVERIDEQAPQPEHVNPEHATHTTHTTQENTVPQAPHQLLSPPHSTRHLAPPGALALAHPPPATRHPPLTEISSRNYTMKTGRWMLIVLVLCSCARSGNAEEPRATTRQPSAPLGAPAAPAAAALPPPSEAAKAFQESYDSEATGKNDAALAALDRLPPAQRDGYVAQLRRGWLLYRAGRHADATAAYTRAIALEPASVEARVGLLAPLLALRRWVDAEAMSREVLRKDPANYTATLKLAFALFNQAKLAEAEATYRSLVSLYPSDVDARSGLGWSQLKQGRTADAARVFGDVLEISPRNSLAQDGLRAATARR
jgi:murein DD-endopeptidase MepM/ murein hydrolase activator NlpD/urea transporter/Flp pilus assembly protein TadD